MTVANIPWFDSGFMNLGSWIFSSQMQKFCQTIKNKNVSSIKMQNSIVEKLGMY